MKKYACLCMVFVVLLTCCMVPVGLQEVAAAEDNVIFSSFEDENINNGTPSWAYDTAPQYSDGVLTLRSSGNANVYLNKTDLRSTILGTAISAGNAKFTLHAEVQVPTYTSGSGATIIEAGFVLGNTVTAALGTSTRFLLVDNGTERTDTYGVPRQVYAKVMHNVSAPNNTNPTSIASGVNFIPGEWMVLDVLVDMSTEKATIYCNYQPVATFTCTKAGLNAAGWKVGFRGFNGVSFRNFSVLNGIETPIAEGITSAQVVLNEKIDVHFTARVPQDCESLRAEISFKDALIEPVCTVSEDTVSGYDRVDFVLQEILPQDISETMTIRLYSGDTLLSEKKDYSIVKYCMRLLPTYSASTGSVAKAELRKLLVSLMNYGAESQKYFTEISGETVLANSALHANTIASAHHDMANAVSVKDASVSTHENYSWKSVTLALYNTVHARFKFNAPSVDNVTVSIDGKIYTNDHFTKAGNGVWTVDYDQISADDFDETIEAVLYFGEDAVQTLQYSVNSYIHAYNKNHTQEDAAYDLVQAIYDYGCNAYAYAN